ncbi:EF-P beta-lysylation protein EpmB [Roseimaritima sediminicola]|uniref:EF-P beta-lysylation protein EpmB n=1 Tax=Roseimaritima sediminicola TaxID=2662066 RepID=UPI0021BC8D88|nr:EF-P beta-lysylation protein EpmB [Roseimaritima sediminicola]
MRWQEAMRRAIRDPGELCRKLDLPESLADGRSAQDFTVFVPLEFLARMRPGDPDDPLLRQVLSVEAENDTPDTYSLDPLAEQNASVLPGLLHKYHGRALLVTSGACAVHCRYCFRRHFPYQTVPKGLQAWQEALDHIAADPTISEVLLSGGDPLTLVDPLLQSLLGALDRIPHVRRLRIHTRLPIVIPQRVTEALRDMLAATRATSWVVVHCNHAAELDGPTLGALARLIDAGVPVLNQAVLLRGVNDSVAALEALSLRLVDHRIQPYYLHQLDRVQGAGHFEVDEATGLQLMAGLRQRVPGYAVPQYVREQPGERSKTPIEPRPMP